MRVEWTLVDDVFKSYGVTLGIGRTGVSGRLNTGCGTRSQYQVPGAGTYVLVPGARCV